MVTLAFVFQVRAVSMNHVQRKDMVFTEDGLEVTFVRRKGKSVRRPLIIRYRRAPDWSDSNPIALIQRWYNSDASPVTSFPLSLADAVQRVVHMLHVEPPAQCHYSGHSARIGGYNELLALAFGKEWIMRRLDWESEAMLRVYHDSRIVTTAHSNWFFAHLL